MTPGLLVTLIIQVNTTVATNPITKTTFIDGAKMIDISNDTHNARLIWITPDSEKLIGKIARVSNPANEDNPDSTGLLKYLIKHRHWSPFEMASMCVEINTTRAIAAQILRHRSFSFQEFSQRYAPVTKLHVPELRRQDKTNRQNSTPDLDWDIVEQYQHNIECLYEVSQSMYLNMLDDGVAKECARAVLPMNTGTRMYMSGTIRSWMHYVDLRTSNGTQLEHMLIANEVLDILQKELPTISAAMWPDADA